MDKLLASIILEDARGILKSVDLGALHGKTVLLTGATGLLGHYFAATLAAACTQGVQLAALYAVTSHRGLPEYFAEMLSGSPWTVLRGDLADPAFLQTLPQADYIIHAAGYGQPGKFGLDPLKTIELNTTATAHLIRNLKPHGRFLFLSSSEVYSGLDNPPFTEAMIGTTNTDHPRSCYIEGKRCGEAIVMAARQQGIGAVAARLALAFGPGTRADDTRVLNSFCRRAIVERQISMLDSGAAMRTYIYVTDAVELMFHALLTGTHSVYNIGGRARVSVLQLAEAIGSIAGVPVTAGPAAQALAAAPGDVFLDMSRAETEFQKSDYTDITIGLRKTYQWQQELFKREGSNHQ